MFTKTLYKIDELGRCREWTVEVDNNKYRTISGLIDGEKVTSECTSAFETLIRIRKEQGCAENIEDAGKGKDWFQCMLASKWDAVKDKIIVDEDHPIYVQPKLDGARNLFSINGQQTRTGKTWKASPHIEEKAKPFFEVHPEYLFDGELYVHSEDRDNFQEIISIVKKSKPTAEDLKVSKEKVQYWIYDLPSYPGNVSEL